MRKISEVLRQRLDLKLPYREIAQSLNISQSTACEYVSMAKLAGISWPLPEGITEQELYEKLFLPVEKSIIERPLPDWEWVHRERRKKGVTLLLLWREYRDIHSNGLGYTQFC